MNPINITFVFGDGTTHDASVTEISTVEELCYNYAWLLVPTSTGLNASPTYSIEVSNTASGPWSAYDPLTQDADILQPFDDTHFAPTYVRINYNAQTNTAGTVSFTLTLKK